MQPQRHIHAGELAASSKEQRTCRDKKSSTGVQRTNRESDSAGVCNTAGEAAKRHQKRAEGAQSMTAAPTTNNRVQLSGSNIEQCSRVQQKIQQQCSSAAPQSDRYQRRSKGGSISAATQSARQQQQQHSSAATQSERRQQSSCAITDSWQQSNKAGEQQKGVAAHHSRESRAERGRGAASAVQ